jgi:hypothetical protein
MVDAWRRAVDFARRWALAAIVVIAAAAAVGSFVYALSQSEKYPPPAVAITAPDCVDPAPGSAALVTRIVGKMKQDQEMWFAGLSKVRVWFYVLTGGGALASLVAAVLVAIREGVLTDASRFLRGCVIVLPIASTALWTASTQFDIRGSANLRARSLATVEKLYARLLASECKPDELRRIFDDLVDAEQAVMSIDGVSLPSSSPR